MEVSNSTGFLLQTMLLMANHQWNNSLYNAIHNVSSSDGAGNVTLSTIALSLTTNLQPKSLT